MFDASFKPVRSGSLLGEYAMLLGDAVLRHRAHHAEQSARMEAETANRLKSEFIANTSHELRTPLNTIIGFSRIMMDCEQRPMAAGQVAEYAGMINEAAEHLLSIINGILDLSKIQSGKLSIEMREVDIENLLRSSINYFAIQAEERKVAIRTDVETGLPSILAEPVKLKQVFMNLISNALKFTQPGGEVVVRAAHVGDGFVEVAVADTGCGMTAQEQAIALTPFGQVDGSHTRCEEGTGLGLPISRALVQLHRATFDVVSEKGVGTTITMVFPNHAVAARASETGARQRTVTGSRDAAQGAAAGAGSTRAISASGAMNVPHREAV